LIETLLVPDLVSAIPSAKKGVVTPIGLYNLFERSRALAAWPGQQAAILSSCGEYSAP
jgi:hypothetical protein